MSQTAKRQKTTMGPIDEVPSLDELQDILVVEQFFPTMEVPITYEQYLQNTDDDIMMSRAAMAFVKCNQNYPLFDVLRIDDTPTTLALTLCLQPLYRQVAGAPFTLNLEDKSQILDAACVTFGHHGVRLMMQAIMRVQNDFQKYSDFLDRMAVEADNIDDFCRRESWSRMSKGVEFDWSDKALSVLAITRRLLQRLRSADARIQTLGTHLRQSGYVHVEQGVAYTMNLTEHGYWELLSKDGGNKSIPFQALGAFS